MTRSLVRPIAKIVLRRVLLGLVTLLLVSIVVFAATQWLPGDAARAITGRAAPPERLLALRAELHLDRPALEQYATWLSAFVQGDLGKSLVNSNPVSAIIGPRLVNSAVLLVLVVAIAVPLALVAGIGAALWRNTRFDTISSVGALALAAVPEFVLAIGLVILFSTVVFHWLPPVSMIRPGSSIFERPQRLVLPVATLVLAVFPYLFRMTRGLVVEVLDSDYIEMARLKGLTTRRIVFIHALPNAVAPLGQAVALVCAYLAGGIVVVEFIFAFPGIGQGLCNAVVARDIPAIQAIVVILAAFYVLVNIVADLFALLMTPRARTRAWQSA